jgi:hypothetical protein
MPPRTVINHDEFIGKTVGRRVVRDAMAYAAGLQRSAVAITERPGLRRVPRGVFRFHSHEEADAWMMHHLTRPKAR